MSAPSRSRTTATGPRTDPPGDDRRTAQEREVRRARRERLKAAHPDTGGSAAAFHEAMRRLPEPQRLKVVARHERSGVAGLLDDLLRELQAARYRRRRTRVD